MPFMEMRKNMVFNKHIVLKGLKCSLYLLVKNKNLFKYFGKILFRYVRISINLNFMLTSYSGMKAYKFHAASAVD